MMYYNRIGWINVEAIIQNIIEVLENIVQNGNELLSILTGMFVIILESMIPMLPLALFIAINLLVFGNLLGFLLSWIATIIGCSMSFFLFRSIRKKWKKKLKSNFMKRIGNMSFSNLVILLAIPFTPAFSLNIGAGLSDMKFFKYLFALLLSKLFLVYFWGFIGTTLIESMTDIGVLFKLGMMIAIAFGLSKWVTHQFDIQ